jgi:REP element-mobilizing transposase RayT
MATPRRLVVDPTVCSVYHCVSRCVRRAFLCGQDSYSGRDFEHRRAWIRERLEELAGLFAVEIFSYSVMSNHLHVVVRNLPGLLASWSDPEVARRWLWLFPGPGRKRGSAPTDAAIQALCEDRRKLALCRSRLRDLSWFMRCLNEPIARRANAEDGCTGHFWEERFKCEKLDDGGATLACMTYADLNPVRAGMAETPEDSDFTSGQDRSVAHRARRQLAHAPANPNRAQAPLLARARAEAARDHWLAPLGERPASPAQGPGGPLHSPHSSPEAPPASPATGQPASPASTQPATADPPSVLAHLSTETYLELLDWTGRQLRTGKRGRLAADLRPVLERLDLDVEAWVDNIAGYASLFHHLAAKLPRLQQLAQASGRAWFQGHRGARRLYAKAA